MSAIWESANWTRTFWEEYVGPESMIFDTLGVYCTCKIEEVFRGKYK